MAKLKSNGDLSRSLAKGIVREKEAGTLEQFYMTPVRRSEVILGKMAPYVMQTALEFLLILIVMRFVFGVPVRGNVGLLFALLLPFTLTMLAFGLLISTKAETKDAAGQMAMGTIIPSIFLSGYVFPLDSMPVPFQWVSKLLPTTWLIDAARGITLRGMDFSMLWPHTLALWFMAIATTAFAAWRMQKR